MPANQGDSLSATPTRAIVYVDGFNLYYGLKSKGLKKFYWLDIEQLAERFLRGGCVLSRVKYFTADIKSAATDKRRRQQTFLDALATHTTKLDIIRGRYLLKTTAVPQVWTRLDNPRREENRREHCVAHAGRRVYEPV